MNFAEHLKQTVTQKNKGIVRFFKNEEKGYFVKMITYKNHSKMVTRNFIFWDFDKLQKSIKKSVANGYRLN